MSGQTLKSHGDAGECIGIPDGSTTGGGEVLRALYDFKATIEQTLDFARHDIFILHSSSNKQKNWWHVINAQGKVGYIPSNYVETVQVSSNYLVSFISRCMQCIERSLPASGGGESGGGKRHQLLKELAERKRRAEGGMRSPVPPRPPTRGPATSCPASPYANAAVCVDSPTKTLKKSATVGQSIGSSVKPAAELPSTNENAPDLLSANQEPAPPEPANQQEAADLPAANQESEQPVSTNQREAESESTNQGEEEANDAQKEVAVDEVSAEDTYRLVQKVRFHTELSFEMSRVAVGVVVSNLLQLLPPSNAPPLEQLLGQLRTGGGSLGGEGGEGGFTPPNQLLDESHDAERLQVVLSELVACKEDAQQRSWELYEDEDAIMEYLQEFTSIIKNADPCISRRVLSRDKCWQLEAVLEYYQMEVRWSIRSRLLDAFLAVCALHRTFVHLFLNSVLPVELARDMQSNVKDVPKLINSAKLLTVILSMGEPMPIPHLEQLGEEFVDFLLLLIEDPPEGNEQISEEFFVVLVSYNLQFAPQSNNIVVEALAKMTHATNFTEKLLFMLNREDDPVRAITQQTRYANSVLKLIVDIFVSRRAANLFYTNDINVLIDIIVRQLTDLSPGDEKRSQYLELCRLVLRNTDYAESQHRCDDLHKCFIHIFCEEGEASRADQALVRDISNEFPHYFKT